MNPTGDNRISRCGACETEIAPQQLSCPSCGRLVHRDELADLVARAKQAEVSGEILRAAELLQDSLDLLPPRCQQYTQIRQHLQRLRAETSFEQPASQKANAGTSTHPPRKGIAKLLGAVGAVGLLLWKFKFIFAFVLSKGKIVLLGLTKGTTFISMFLAFGVYWAAFGWKFAAGLVLSIYLHEMGHVIALRRHGIDAGAPMFIPGIGAFVRLNQHIDDPQVDARIGLAGPVAGLVAALLALGLGVALDWPAALAIARIGAWINLFNLLPAWQLDGGRAFNALSRGQRGWATGAIALSWLLSNEGLLVLLLLAAGIRTAAGGAPQKDRLALWSFVVLIGIFSWLTMLEVPGLTR